MLFWQCRGQTCVGKGVVNGGGGWPEDIDLTSQSICEGGGWLWVWVVWVGTTAATPLRPGAYFKLTSSASTLLGSFCSLLTFTEFGTAVTINYFEHYWLLQFSFTFSLTMYCTYISSIGLHYSDCKNVYVELSTRMSVLRSSEPKQVAWKCLFEYRK